MFALMFIKPHSVTTKARFVYSICTSFYQSRSVSPIILLSEGWPAMLGKVTRAW